MRHTYLAAALTFPLIAAAAPSPYRADATLSPLADLTSYELVRIDSGVAVPTSLEQAAGVLKDYDVIFLGEWHDHPANHLAEMALFRMIHERTPQLALSMEQFERDAQPVVDDYMAGRIGEDALRSKGRAWPNYAESYRPLVEYAKENHLPVIAANAPGSIVRCVGQEGPEFLSRLSPEKRTYAAAELHLADGAYKDKFLRFLAEDGGHGDEDVKDKSGGGSESDLRGFAAQVTRDDTMAESIYLYVRKNPGHKVVHITGVFHAESFLGTVERLKLRAPELKIAVVTAIQADDPQRPEVSASDAKTGTFAVVLRKTPESYANEAEKNAAEAKIRSMIRTRATCTP